MKNIKDGVNDIVSRSRNRDEDMERELSRFLGIPIGSGRPGGRSKKRGSLSKNRSSRN